MPRLLIPEYLLLRKTSRQGFAYPPKKRRVCLVVYTFVEWYINAVAQSFVHPDIFKGSCPREKMAILMEGATQDAKQNTGAPAHRGTARINRRHEHISQMQTRTLTLYKESLAATMYCNLSLTAEMYKTLLQRRLHGVYPHLRKVRGVCNAKTLRLQGRSH